MRVQAQPCLFVFDVGRRQKGVERKIDPQCAAEIHAFGERIGRQRLYVRARRRYPWVAHEALLAAWQGENGGADPAAAYRRFVSAGVRQAPESPFRDLRVRKTRRHQRSSSIAAFCTNAAAAATFNPALASLTRAEKIS